ncbi:MAG: S8 family serine peptidase [Bdellovibrionaceae bacterium]|nr:S8 family serine peptidase [Pseudobdellovibrionaceae bacterium]
MNSLKMSFGIALFFGLFIGALAIHYSTEGTLEEASLRFNKKLIESKSAPQDRLLEPSKITSQIPKVEDEPSALFNDPAINQAWGLQKTNAARAWSVSQGSRGVVVAVIDTGADVKHEDLRNNFWKNPGEVGLDSKGKDKSNNGIDDDGNGYIDDVNGWNFVSNNNNLTDNHGHGTHIAGIIGAEGGNSKGIIGIAPQVSLMILKYFDPKTPATDNLKNTVNSIKYAIKMGANVINYSGGGLEFSQEEHDAVAEAQKNGILFVAAAGNEKSNSDKIHYYPADYKLSNIISVTAYDPSMEVLASSNYGVETVDLAAPGQNILSTLPGNSYGYMTGTSQATAFVSGAVVLIMANQPAFKSDDIKKYILKTGDAMSSLADKTSSSRRLNLFKALTTLDQEVSATGIIAVNTDNLQGSFSSSPQKKKPGSQATKSPSDMTDFGKHLLNLMEKPKNPKLGTKPSDNL